MSTVEAPASHLPLPMQNILSRLAANSTEAEQALVRKAYAYAAAAHAGQVRLSGEPYLSHPLAVAEVLAELGFDAHAVAAGLLHDTVEDTKVTLEEVDAEFGEQVADIVDGVTKISMMTFDSKEEQQAENIRKMILAMSHDIRVPIVKLADRVHNMRTLDFQKAHKRQRIAQETMDIYVPLANRLGLHRIKLELEGLSFKYIHPDVYAQISDWLESNQVVERQLIAKIIAKLEGILSSNQIEGTVWGRIKHIYSIYKKMTEQNLTLDDMHDILAFRAIVKDVRDCYAVLGLVHAQWKPVPGRFKDYISMPKANGYQSLHTTVIGPAGRPLEVQIRTEDMHRQSEYGVAAHWRYKEKGGKSGDELDQQLAWLRQMVDWQDESQDSREFLKDLKVDLAPTEVFVFTPKGEVMSLRAGSTPVDFAYAIHTEVGNHCVGAKVNGAIVPLTYELQLGDRVDILTQKSASPSRDWLGLVKTPSARSKIRSYFSKVSRSDDLQFGRDKLTREMRKHGLGISSAQSMRALKSVADHMGYNDADDMLVHIGTGKESAQHVANRLLKILVDKGKEAETAMDYVAGDMSTGKLPPMLTSVKAPKKHEAHTSNGVVVKGVDDVLVRLSRCCNPVPGDDILGFVTRGRGVSVHRADCPNAQDLKQTPERIIDVAWENDLPKNTSFKVEVFLDALDRMNLLRDVAVILSEQGANVLSSSTTSHRDGMVEMRFLFQVSSINHIDIVLSKLRGIEGVFDARRMVPKAGGGKKKTRSDS